MKFGYFSALHDPDLEKGFSVVLDDFLTELAFVEELGFEGVWTGEHHLGPRASATARTRSCYPPTSHR